MNWRSLNSEGDLNDIIEDSHQHPQAILKHSTRCGISAMVKKRLELQWEAKNPKISIYILDLLANRELSNTIAQKFDIQHESPQLILLQNGVSTYHASHIGISSSAVAKHIQS
ncbi:MAG: bacillithiol system redox-active protein YtxJ [Flavobacteriales bacterium]|nr:bacillithiol system redox-active protein YtxJ [Flavobacteriales bacterium]|tara:strand:- start:880 stop:1218 length:339 start_codon:yes stop_codon:yes gene_type:complete